MLWERKGPQERKAAEAQPVHSAKNGAEARSSWRGGVVQVAGLAAEQTKQLEASAGRPGQEQSCPAEPLVRLIQDDR